MRVFHLYTIFACCLLANLYRRLSMWFIYTIEVSSTLVSIYILSICQGMRFIIFKRHQVTKSELLIGCNQTSSLVKSSTSSSVLVKVYWLDDESSPSVYHRYWSGLLARWQKTTFGMSWSLMIKRLIPETHCYAKVVARWLKVLASYAKQSNLIVITSRIVLERLRTWRVALSLR